MATATSWRQRPRYVPWPVWLGAGLALLLLVVVITMYVGKPALVVKNDLRADVRAELCPARKCPHHPQLVPAGKSLHLAPPLSDQALSRGAGFGTWLRVVLPGGDERCQPVRDGAAMTIRVSSIYRTC